MVEMLLSLRYGGVHLNKFKENPVRKWPKRDDLQRRNNQHATFKAYPPISRRPNPLRAKICRKASQSL